MDIFRTDDKRVTKFIHDDTSETCIKTVYSVDYKPNTLTGEVEIKETDRNKYSIFISSSAGCPMNCTFCYLTIDKMPHRKLMKEEILCNVKEAIYLESKVTDLSKMYVKVCWMGMGEGILKADDVADLTIELLDWIMDSGLALGLDGVDISTVLPKVKDKWVHDFYYLNKELEDYPLNPNNKNVVNQEKGWLVEYKDRSRFRLFFSLHSAIQDTRERIIPNAMVLEKAIPFLHDLEGLGVNVIIHHMFLEGINDSEDEVSMLIDFMNEEFPHNELRILRYNKHDKSDIRESDTFEQCVCMLQGEVEKVKVQVSYGKDVQSACGQFIYNKAPELEKFKISK